MLYYAFVLMGQSLGKNMSGRMEIRSKGMQCFVDACKLVALFFLIYTSLGGSRKVLSVYSFNICHYFLIWTSILNKLRTCD